MLYSRFVVALKTGSTYTPISNAIYVTNPGDVAKYREAYPEPMSKKGILIQLDSSVTALNHGCEAHDGQYTRITSLWAAI